MALSSRSLYAQGLQCRRQLRGSREDHHRQHRDRDPEAPINAEDGHQVHEEAQNPLDKRTLWRSCLIIKLNC